MIAAILRRASRSVRLAWWRREHRQDIARVNSLHAQLDTLRGEEQLAILAAIGSGRRLAELEPTVVSLEVQHAS